jgi:glucosamine--fructose-6-phosphate aminotransferase (isomerizing)
MEREMREQPAVLAANSERYFGELCAALRGSSFDMVLLAARGSSDNAALFARYLIEVHLGIPVSLAAPSVITKYGTDMRYPPCLAVGISQSGAAPDVSEVVAHLRSKGHKTLAITNTAGSRLSGEAEFSLQLGVGDESSVAATKTYTSSLLALYQLVRALGAHLPTPSLPDEAYVEAAQLAAQGAVGALLRSRTLFALARGYRFCSAFETALKLMECALLPCKAYSSADFEHGPKALATHGTAAIVFGDVPRGLEAAGCIAIPAPTREQEECRPFFDAVFGQWVALHTARARGLDPDAPDGLNKVTETL